MEMTIQQKVFNGRFAEYLKTVVNRKPSIYKIMLKANELYAMSYGKYPETDEVWVKALCYQLLKVVEDFAWAQFPPEEKEAQDLLCYMSICELDAVRV